MSPTNVRSLRWPLTSAALSVLLIASNALAQQTESTDGDDGSAALEETRVWGTRVVASSLNLDQQAIELKQADHISDLLRPIPGVDVGGAHSLNQRITIRSMDDKDLRISIDGANQNTYMYHHMGNLQIHADILKSVEIDVGTNSVVNGGLGGAVRFETKEAKDLLTPGRQVGARLEATGSSNSGHNLSGAAYAQLGDVVDVLAYYNHVQRDNYEVGGGRILGADGGELPNTDGEVRGLKGEIDDALLKVGFDITRNQRLSFSYERYADQGDYSYRPDMGLATDLAITASLQVPLLWPTEFTRDTFTANYDAEFGHTTLKAALFTNDSTLWRDESGYANNPDFASWAAIVEGEADNSGFNVLAETRLPGQVSNTLTYGVDVIRYETHYRAAYTESDSVDTSAEEATSSAVFVQDRIEFGKFAVIPGLRYDEFDLESVVATKTFDEVTGSLAAEFRPLQPLVFKLSATQLFQGPEPAEVFIGAGLFDEANPDLEAETGRNDELSFAYGDSVLGASYFSLGATVFRTDIEGYIYQYAGPAKDNVGDMEVSGVEAYIGYDLGGLSTLLTYSDAESELDAYAEYDSLDGARIDRQQGDTWSLSVDYQLTVTDLTLHWDVMHVGDVPAGPDLDGATLDNAKAGFTVHNISARWLPRGGLDSLELTLGVDNVFDEFYASQSSRTGVSFHPRFGQLFLTDYEPGRNIKATVAYRF